MFKHELGIEAASKVTWISGIITARSENLYGCNRYYVQPRADREMKLPDGWWIDEDDVNVIGPGVVVHQSPNGGPMSKIR